MIYGGYNQATSYSSRPTNTPRFTQVQTYIAPTLNPYEAELLRKEAELQKLRKDKKHSDFFIKSTLAITAVCGLIKLFARAKLPEEKFLQIERS